MTSVVSGAADGWSEWYEPVLIARFDQDSRIQVQDPCLPVPAPEAMATWGHKSSRVRRGGGYAYRYSQPGPPENGGSSGKGKGKPTGRATWWCWYRRRAGRELMGGWWGTIQASERYSRVAAQARTDGRTRRWKVPTRPAGAGGSQVHAAPRASARAVPCRALRAGACVTGKGCRGLRRGGVVRETSRSRSQFNAAAGSRMRRLSLPGGRTARARAEVLAGSVLWSPALDKGGRGWGGVLDGTWLWPRTPNGDAPRASARVSGLHGRLATGADRLVRRVRFVAAKVWFVAAGPCYRIFRSPSVTRRATLSAGLWTAN
jgi:hypothetical protein